MPKINLTILLLWLLFSTTSCEKLVAVEDPIDTITTTQIFSSDVQAQSALGGMYSVMINDRNSSGNGRSEITNGATTIYAGLSADELTCYSSWMAEYRFVMNHLLQDDPNTPGLWASAYNIIYSANSIVEGVAASTAPGFSAGARKRIAGEARFVRAFTYFYLLNFFGDVPLVLTVDFNKTRNYSKTATSKVYEQIIDDLLIAQADLPPVNTSKGGERIYPDKWAATALLARVHLYTKDYENAYKQSDAVIGNTAQTGLEMDLDKVFLKDSREAIWQMKQNSNHAYAQVGNATPEGFILIPSSLSGEFNTIIYPLTDQLLSAFEPGDKRYEKWVHKSGNTSALPKEFYFPYKYKTGPHNAIVGADPTEYYVMLRLAEQYLIRAEAAANGAAALTGAIDDLNELRKRAGLGELPDNLSQPQVLEAIAQERRVELFTEWGHRWFDLKRTEKAVSTLSQIPFKQPWQGDYQLLYPIPTSEMLFNSNLKPNPGYF